jgi:carbamoyltransferase
MNILGFNPFHHGSVCLLEDGELKFFIQEERIGNRKKYQPYPFRSFIDIIQNYKIDLITWGAPSVKFFSSSYDNTPLWQALASSYQPNVRYIDFSLEDHHKCHAAHSFYNSGFKEAISIVIDGVGSKRDNLDYYRETESIFSCSYPCNFEIIYKNIINIYELINLSRAYETVTMHLGWTRDEAGKTMGLAPYGKFTPHFPNFFSGDKGNPDVFYYDDKQLDKWTGSNKQTFINEENTPQLKLSNDPREWHYDESKITDLEKDLAWKIQNDTQQIVGDYIESAIKETGLKQVCCAGGYFLNCVTNYYLIKRFPDVEFYFEPIANDAGTAIGAAKLLWHCKTQDTTIRPFKSLYLGKQYSKDELLERIKKYT